MERNIAALFERGSLYLKRQEEPTVYNRAYSTETSEERNWLLWGCRERSGRDRGSKWKEQGGEAVIAL